MSNDRHPLLHNTALIRAKDIGLLISVLTLIGMLFGPLRRVFEIENTIAKVEKMDERITQNSTQIAVINSQYADIGKQLEQINWQLRRLRDGR